MKAVEAYSHFVNNIFGANSITLDTASDERNHITAAIERFYENGYDSFFAYSLMNRLNRLKTTLQKSPGDYHSILSKVRNLAFNNWEGPYSELAAYDFFSAYTSIELEINVSSEETMASHLPWRQGSSFDGKLPEIFDVKFEVKSFQDNNKKIINEIVSHVLSQADKVEDISYEYPLDMDYIPICNHKRAIITELLEEIENNHPVVYTCKDFPALKFTFYEKKQPLKITTYSYSPYKQAQDWKNIVLNHFDQLFLDEVNLRVYVLHPWFNLINNDFNHKDVFFRSFARRVFCELTRSHKHLNELMPYNFGSIDNIKACDIASKISGILFLVDNNVVPSTKFYNVEDPLTVLEAYLYRNPNVNHKNRNDAFFDDFYHKVSRKQGIERELLKVYETFEFDNY